MGFKAVEESRAEGVGWYQSGVFDARDILERVGAGEMGYIEPEEPCRDEYSGSDLYKITVIVEKQ